MTYILFFLLGLCVGSFLNVLIYRETQEESFRVLEFKSFRKWLPSWLVGRSYCDHCKKKIAWHDNIPLLSFVLLGGRCRHCRKKISIQYPLVELLTGIEFVWIYFLVSSQLAILSRFEGFYSLLTLLVWLLIGTSLLTIFVADLKFQIIPDVAVFAGIIGALLKIYFDYRFTGLADFSTLWSACFAALFFLFLVFITKGKGMGWGDVKLVIFLGLLLGWPEIVLCLFLAFLTGAMVAVILVIIGAKKFKDKIAFGPFLIIVAVITLFYGEVILKWYIQGFLSLY